jgi:uncharacterized protein YecA (UPF0149 family)
MQIERHVHSDGSESLVKRLFEAKHAEAMREQLDAAYRKATKQKTLKEIKQVQFDPDDPCPCGSPRKAKNCCAGRILRRLARERYEAEKAEG